MDNIYDNPVEIIKKDIYVIKNKINAKVYIGQSINANKRFKEHCKRLQNDSSLINSEIQKLGIENFYMEILEHQITNYDAREEYWINYYNSQIPNGYNIQKGGSSPPIYFGINHPNASIKEFEILIQLKNDLKNTNLSLSQIAKKYNTNKRTIVRINSGISYQDLNEDYPIRKIPNINGNLNDNQVLEIIEILQFSYRQYGDISKQFNVTIKTIQDINLGNSYKQKDIRYPIRKYKNSGQPIFTYEQVTEIIDLLNNSNMSIQQITKKYNLKYTQPIYSINNGSSLRYKRDGLLYPLRKF